MRTNAYATDTVRASREGHCFHEAWTARKAMQLLLPMDGLIGIAVEGLSEEDQSRASPGTVEIADLTIYYGQDANFRDAERVETLQFKYSPKRAEKPFRASDAKKTIEKFAESYHDYRKNYSAAAVSKKLFFELITNRPIYPPLQRAIDGIAKGRRLTGDAKAQAVQFEKASGLTDKPLAEFASKCRINGLAGTLLGAQTDLRRILVDWSATADAQANARLGAMRDLVTRKAGYDAKHNKVIRQVDVLDVLGLSGVDELLPCPERLARVDQVVEREQLTEAVSLVPAITKPLIVSAGGGIGKTVFLRSLASQLSHQYEVVFFDCFGGGAYRSPEDGRHLPYRGLVHIANVLACRGLCDPILPDSQNTEILFGRFRKRLLQCVRTLSAVSPGTELILFIDGIDNAAEHAIERGQQAFPTLLLESVHLSGPIPNVKIIASGRTHRIKKHISNVLYHNFELHPFTTAETRSYVSSRMAAVTATEINVVQSRSEGNPRILEHLVTSDRGLLDPSELGSPIVLDELLNKRVEKALGEAFRQGNKEVEINAFLAGLSVLPPPVPLDEYAGAYDMDVGAIESFAADLAPLLERTRQGMIFRDEPTETFVRENYGADERALKRVARNLHARQGISVYAALALPGLLHRLGDGKKLFSLAFDERFPPTITSTIGQRRIRYARLKSAVLFAANAGDNNSLVRLLVELSTIAASDQRGAAYILENPDLVVNAREADALRRLYETRTSWPGSRHARLTIASVLSGDLDDASRHFTNAFDWIRHDYESARNNDNRRQRPEQIDHAAIPLFHVAQGKQRQATGFMRIWYPWYAFEISGQFFELCCQAIRRDPELRPQLDAFLDDLTSEIGLLAGAMSFVDLTDQRTRELLGKLAKVCKRTAKVKTAGRYTDEPRHELPDGLRKAAAIAASFGMAEEALGISLRAPHARPQIWSMVDLYSDGKLLPFLFRVALRAAVKGTEVQARDILPSELYGLAKGIDKSLPLDQLQMKLKEKLQKQIDLDKELAENERQIRGGVEPDTDRFLDHRLAPLLELTRAFASFLGSRVGQADRPFKKLINVWKRVRTNREGYHYESQISRFFHLLGTRVVTFALWARKDLRAASARFLLKYLHQTDNLPPSTLIEVIATVASRSRFGVISGEQAVRARSLIEREDDVNTRAVLFAELARAILPVSADEAAEYFRTGLEQLDAIGSGDYDFTNTLLHFASAIKGDELPEKDFHTLTNICELNMPYNEEEKFTWATFGTAMSKTAGPRGLAKISRWHDRGKISLEYTLLPYLTALARDGKIDPEDALALNRLADPAELWACNTETFGTAIHEKCFSNAEMLIRELIRQYEENNPRFPSENTAKELAAIAGKDLGKQHATTKYLSSAHQRLSEQRHDLNEQQNFRPSGDARHERSPNDTEKQVCHAQEIAAATNPLDDDSLRNALSQLKDVTFTFKLESELFRRLRTRVRLADRSKYIGLVARLEELDTYDKLEELAECKKAWATSSAGLDTLYLTLATPILHIHAEGFLDFGRLSTPRLREVSDLTGVPLPELILQVVKVFSVSDWDVPASAWLGAASIICGDADVGQGQEALGKLLNSGSAKLTSKVEDGPWKRDLYPTSEMNAIPAGLVWQLLGSPLAADRWRAAHSVRCFARLGRWEVIDALARKLPSMDSKPFGAPELPFYYLHARLWLLITLARISLDFPGEIANYQEALMCIALDDSHPHVVIRHFAKEAVLACDKAGVLSLSQKQREQLRTVNDSPFACRINRGRHYDRADFYKRHPDHGSNPDDRFFLDWDFDKYDVHDLANVYARQGWAVRDLIADEVHRLDPSVTSMYDDAGREIPFRRPSAGLTSSFDVYGQYLAWHALGFVAARLLSQHPITEDEEHCERWTSWLSNKLLTRSDGLWLSDGMDRPPLSVKVNVLEKAEEGLVLTGDREKLISLVGIDGRTVGRELVVEGNWKSPDGIDIHISSALVHGRKGRKLAKELLEKDDAYSMWLPTIDYDDEEHDHFRTDKDEYQPWIVSPTYEGGKLDRHDPLSVISVERRPRFVASVAGKYSLRAGDPFGRTWLMPRRKIAATTDAWGFEIPYEDGGERCARLVCRREFLNSVLEWKNADLILMIKLSRYVEGDRINQKSRFYNTVAVLRVRKGLKFEYFAGPVNQVKQLRY